MKKFCYCLLFLAAGAVFGQSGESAFVDKVFYLGGSGGLGSVFEQEGAVLGGNISPLRFDWQMSRFLALETGMHFYFGPQVRHSALKESDPASGIMETYVGTETHIIFPLSLKTTLRPGVFSFELGGGIYASVVAVNTTVERTNSNGFTTAEAYGKNLFKTEKENGNPLGFAVSGNFGVKIGQGIVFLDAQYLRDFSETSLKFKDTVLGDHLWNILVINIGFKYGFLDRK